MSAPSASATRCWPMAPSVNRCGKRSPKLSAKPRDEKVRSRSAVSAGRSEGVAARKIGEAIGADVPRDRGPARSGRRNQDDESSGQRGSEKREARSEKREARSQKPEA